MGGATGYGGCGAELGPELLRDIALVCLAVGVVGASYGAITVSEGLPVWTPSYMSVVVFAGASQFLFTGVVAAGGSPVAAVLAGLLVNARHLPFGFALADTVKDRRLLGSYLMIDEVVAFALAQRDPHRRRVAFFTCGILLWVCWNVGALLGGAGRHRDHRHRRVRARRGLPGRPGGAGAARPAEPYDARVRRCSAPRSPWR